MPKAVILDYGVGNLYSLKCALSRVGFTPLIGFSKAFLKQADAVILPGVGNFSAASKRLATVKEHLADLADGGLLFWAYVWECNFCSRKVKRGLVKVWRF
ncbi:MAG: hypothetical protein QXJ07_03715 [Candidatus Bathyarchaeia archaeon]